jgi:hypothetical protein
MGLKKVSETDFGVTAEYWSISNTFIDHLNSRSVLNVDLYVSKAAKTNGKQRIKSLTFSLDGTDFPFSVAAMKAKDVLAIGYDAIKLKSEFTGSEDV